MKKTLFHWNCTETYHNIADTTSICQPNEIFLYSTISDFTDFEVKLEYSLNSLLNAPDYKGQMSARTIT